MKTKPVRLPADGLPHDSVVEWWYFNGHLADKKGNKYAFMDCLFRVDLKRFGIPFLGKPLKKLGKIPYGYFDHSVLSDITKQKTYKEVHDVSFTTRDSFTKPQLFANYYDPLTIEGPEVNEIAEIEPNVFRIKTSRLDLLLTARKPILLEGGKGHITVRGLDSYYYSLTDLHAKGMVRAGKEWVNVEGISWMDHQWMDVGYQKGGAKWSWFSIQLENGIDLMCVEFDDGEGKDYYVDVQYPDGHTHHGKKLVLIPGQETWKSRKTKASYPMQWTLQIPELDIALSAKALMRDQELIFGKINYWEGPLSIVGTMGKENIKGLGFMELVGYPSDYSAIALSGKEFAEKMLHFFS